MEGLQDSVDSVIRTIASQISAANLYEKSTDPVSLLLSTGRLQQQQQPKDQSMVCSWYLGLHTFLLADMVGKGNSPSKRTLARWQH